MANREKFTCEQVILALEQSAGIYSIAAELLSKATGKHCAANTIKGYIERHPSVAEAFERVSTTNIDIAEAELLKQIRDGNTTAIIFYLKTKGRDRGYVERRMISGDPDGAPVKTKDETPTIDVSKLSTQQLKTMRDILGAAKIKGG